MTSQEILQDIGQFSSFDLELFDKHSSREKLNKNEILLREGEVCRDFYFVLSGSFVQFQSVDLDDKIIDLHVENAWMFNQESLTEQMPSRTSFKAFSESEVIVLSLTSFHILCTRSSSFLQFGRILNQAKDRTLIFDNSYSPTDKYNYITREKPELIRIFPLKIIASYLKVTPETLSRVRANH
jgi:CRP-like cAMP-binding protein